MYADYFGLDEPPFAITPDPRYLYLGRRHAEALAHLLYGIRAGGGFVLLTGEVGTGKTTLTRCLLDELPAEVDVAFILNPRLDVTEFLEAICQELGLPQDGGNRRLVDALNRHLLDAHARGRRTVLIVDEAQNLSADVLEQVRLLTNLETAKTKLLQIVLIGQPELRDLLARPELRQLAQRVTARYHLEPLDRDELDAYVAHRLGVAGARGPLFGRPALRSVWRHSHGVPRRVNILCDRALLGAFTLEAREVSSGMVRRAAHEIDGGRPSRRWRAIVTAGIAALGLAAAILLLQPNLIGRVTAGAAAPAATPLPDWLATHAASAGTDIALDTLFDRWRLDYRPGATSACAQAEATGLRCLHGRGTWGSLRELDRPAVLELVTDAGGRYQVVLTALSADTATLRAGRAARKVAAAELGLLWSGEYLALWRPPYAGDPPLGPGARGPAVVELRARLDELLGPAPLAATEPALYDAALADRVREFQAREGLRIDGIVGEQTMLRMAALLHAPGTPLLSATR